MPRIRTIKPDFWGDESLADLPYVARLLFIGTWNLADDYGILKASPRWIKGQLFPYDDALQAEQIKELLDVLVVQKFLVDFQCVGEQFYIVRKFRTHQAINHPTFKGCISPEKLAEELDLKDLPRNFPEYSGIITEWLRVGKERKGKERKGKEYTGNSPKKPDQAPPGVGDACASPSEKDLKDQYLKIDIKDIKVLAKWVADYKPKFVEPYLAFWNLFAAERKIPTILKLNDTRRRKFAVRIREKDFDFVAILRKAAHSAFVLEGNWFTFDWIIENEKNYLKVLEGNYIKKQQNSHEQPGAGGEKLAKAVAQIEENLKNENGLNTTKSQGSEATQQQIVA